MKNRLLVLFFVMAVIGCQRSTKVPAAAPDHSLQATPFVINVNTKWKTAEEFDYLLRQTPVHFKLEIPEGYNDPGDFIRIRIQTSGRPEFALTNEDGWVEYNNQEQKSQVYAQLKSKNLARSKYVLILPSDQKRHDPPLVFLRSWGYASNAERLHVIGFRPSGEPLVLFNDELDLTEVRDLDGDGYVEFTGSPCTSQSLGWTEEYELGTYVPDHVYKIPHPVTGPARLSERLSKKSTIQGIGKWAGADCNGKYVIVRPKTKTQSAFVLTEAEAHELRRSAKYQ